MSETAQPTARVGRRVRHETKMRLLQVRDVSRLTPKMVRVVVGGDALAGFVSASYDDHVKLFFPHPGEEKPVLPTPSPNGPVYPEGVARPPSRDYTPRRYDAAASTLTLDFVLHDAGPATAWAAQAQPGHFLGVGGPRGSFGHSRRFRLVFVRRRRDGLASHRPPAGRIARDRPRSGRRRSCGQGRGAAIYQPCLGRGPMAASQRSRNDFAFGGRDCGAAHSSRGGVCVGGCGSQQLPRLCASISSKNADWTRSGSKLPPTGSAAPSPSTRRITIKFAVASIADQPSQA